MEILERSPLTKVDQLERFGRGQISDGTLWHAENRVAGGGTDCVNDGDLFPVQVSVVVYHVPAFPARDDWRRILPAKVHTAAGVRILERFRVQEWVV